MRLRPALLGGLLVMALALSACAPMADAEGRFRPELFFAGSSVSRGEIRTLLLFREAFAADFSGTGTGGELVLDERFHFEEGDRLQRWRLSAVPGGRYAGTVETEDGEGRLSPPVPVSGYRTAQGLVIDYDGFAPGGGAMVLHFRHVMEMQGDGSVSNRVRISKFGLPIAGADVVFSKPATPGS